MQFSKSLLIQFVLALLLPAFAWATYPAEVARTGQTACYYEYGTIIDCTGTGQDGEIQAGMAWPDPRFTVNGDEVTDGLTGLVWAKNANLMATRDPSFDADGTVGDGAVIWQQALDYVAKLNNENYLGHNDWRLPNINELESLLNAQLYSPALPQGHPFTNVQSSYWSSTSGASYTDRAWFVGMYFGDVDGGSKTFNSYVWPVRSGQCGSLGTSVICLPKTGQTLCYDTAGATITCSGTGQDGEYQAGVAWPSQRFVDNSDGTVTDSLTGLEWTKNANLAGATKTWQQALDYVKTVNTGGHNDWRLPNERELRSLADYSKYNLALPQGYPFTNVQSYNYWSSTSNAYNTGNAWIVHMYYGYVYNYYKTYTTYVWPVRLGQVGNSLISSTTTTLTTTTSMPPGAYPAEVARTGQTACYDDNGTIIDCTGTGQDGAIQAGAVWPDPRFTDRGDGTISDNLTGLVWAQNANLLGTVDADNDTDGTAGDGSVFWQHALDYIKKLNRENYLGYSDWRLPNINELASLINDQLYNPALPQNHPFTNVQSDFYWSSTTHASLMAFAWGVGMFADRAGYVAYGNKNDYYPPSMQETRTYVWPVRAGQCGSFSNSVICLPKTGQTECYDYGNIIDCTGTGQDGDIQAGVAWPNSRFEDHGDGTVSDSLTGLEWTKDAGLAGATWQEALNYVAGMNAGTHPNFGYTDWRLPNNKELLSLSDYSRFPEYYPFTYVRGSDFYWSSTSCAFNPYNAWAVRMYSGSGTYGFNKMCSPSDCWPPPINSYVWPVRAGQVGNQVISTTTTTVPSTTTTTTVTVGPCPATKVLGADNPKLENLRDFRDSRLAQSSIGRKAIQIYYSNADSINATLERSPALRAVTRRVLEVIAPMIGKKEE